MKSISAVNHSDYSTQQWSLTDKFQNQGLKAQLNSHMSLDRPIIQSYWISKTTILSIAAASMMFNSKAYKH